MTLRLIVAFFAVLLSFPTTAAPACHDAPVAAASAAAGHAHRQPVQHDLAKAHSCVGCVPLGDWMRAPLSVLVVTRAPAPVARVATLDLGDAVPPALPPPRLA